MYFALASNTNNIQNGICNEFHQTNNITIKRVWYNK